MAFFLWHGLASSTRSTYRTGQKYFTDFIILYPQFRNPDGSVLQASQATLLEWVAWLGGTKRLQPKMIKSYITHLQSAHIDADLPFSACESLLLQRVICGIKRYMGKHERNPKLPITCNVLGCMLEATSHSSMSDKLNFEASTMTAFVGFLRCGEFTVLTGLSLDPSINLTRSCVEFMPSILSPSHIILTIPSSKTDPFRKGVSIAIASMPGARTCAVNALKSLFEYVPWPPEVPLFSQDSNAPLSRGKFIAQVKSNLAHAGFDASKFSGHSFRRGVASSAATVGLNDYEIQQLGRWRSNSYKLYVDGSQSRVLSLSARLHWVVPHGQHFEPPSLCLPSSLA